jgi:drug/metabolite transporter (DMT)-like permease
MTPASHAHRLRLVLAFAAVYLIWGSTYLGIRLAIDSIPPLIMAGTRLLLAGALLMAWARARGAAWPTPAEWRSTALIGVMLLAVGNGTVTWTEQKVPSGLVALMVATVPIWMSVLSRIGTERGARSGLAGRVLLGVLMGVAGIVLLIGPGAVAGQGHIDPIAAGALAVSSFCWALGSLIARRIPLPRSPMVATAAEMLIAGAVLTVAGLAVGEGPRLRVNAITPVSLGAFVYLVTFGSIVAFTAYVWLLRVSTPARVSTYAFVNPVVAVLLGWAILGESLTVRTGIAAAIIISAVALITSAPVPSAARMVPAPVPGAGEDGLAAGASTRSGGVGK